MEAPASITIIAESARQGLEGEYEREERYDRGRTTLRLNAKASSQTAD